MMSPKGRKGARTETKKKKLIEKGGKKRDKRKDTKKIIKLRYVK